MTQKHLNMIKEYEKNIVVIAGKEVSKLVVAEFDTLKSSSNNKKIAQWVKKSIEKLETTIDKEKTIQIMEKCGNNCAKVNQRVITQFKNMAQKFKTEEEFIDNLLKTPKPGTRVEREGQTIHYYYIPQSFSRPMRCFCGLVNGLPADEIISPIYCHCSKALVKTMWENALNRPVQVEVLETAISGASQCHFTIKL